MPGKKLTIDIEVRKKDNELRALNKEIRDTTDQYIRAVREFGKGSAQAKIAGQNYAKAKGDVKAVKQELRELEGVTKNQVNSWLNMGKNLAAIGIGFGLLLGQVQRFASGFVRAVGTVVNALIEVEKSNRKLVASSKLFGVSLSELKGLAKSAKDEFKLSTVFANDFVTEITKLTSMAGQTEKTGDVLRSALDLGAAQGLDAEGILTAIHQTILGIDEGTDKLFQKNPSQIYKEYAESINTTVGKMTDLQKKQALVNEFLEKGGLVQGEYNKTLQDTGGLMQVIKVSFEDILQEIATSLQPVIAGVAGFVADFATNLKELPTSAKIAVGAIGLVIVAVGALTAAFVALAFATSTATAGITFLIGAGVVALGGALAGVTALVVSHIKEVMAWWNANTELRASFNGLLESIQSLIPGSNSYRSIAQSILSVLAELAKFILPKAISQLQFWVNVLKAGFTVGKFFYSISRAIYGFFVDVVNWISKAVSKFESFNKVVGDSITGLGTLKLLIGQSASTALLDGIASAANVLFNSLLGVIGLIREINNTPVQKVYESDNLNNKTKSAVDLIQSRIQSAEDKVRKKRQKPPGSPKSDGKGSDKKDEKNLVDELIKKIKEEVSELEEKGEIEVAILNTKIQELETGKALGKNEEDLNKILEYQKELQKKITEITKERRSITQEIVAQYKEEVLNLMKLQQMALSPQTFADTIIKLTANDANFSGASKLSEADEERKHFLESGEQVWGGINQIFSELPLKADSFVSIMINGFNSVLNIIGGIINILNNAGNFGSGLFGFLGGLLSFIPGGSIAAGAANAIPGFNTGVRGFTGDTMVVGDGPGGSMTPFTEIITRSGSSPIDVFSNRDVMKLFDSVNRVKSQNNQVTNVYLTGEFDGTRWYEKKRVENQTKRDSKKLR